jgi:hypothetical protein
MGILVFIEAMHLLPQSFDFRRLTPPPKRRLSEQRHSSSQLLFGSFRKACRTSSRGRLFRFQARLHQSPRSSCGSCPLSSVLSDERVTPKSRTGRLNGNTEASRSLQSQHLVDVRDRSQHCLAAGRLAEIRIFDFDCYGLSRDVVRLAVAPDFLG